jgi:hypothetical protein
MMTVLHYGKIRTPDASTTINQERNISDMLFCYPYASRGNRYANAYFGYSDPCVTNRND